MSDDVAALFTLPPEEFVGARDALAKRLRAEGARDGAQRVRQLRRPTVPAWAVDQLPRLHAQEVDLLIEAGSQLRLAQQQVLSGHGGAGPLREAAAHRREVVDRLAQHAARILADAGRDPDPHRLAIAATLEAATVDDDAAAAVRSGTLSKELVPPTGLEDLTLPAHLPAPPAPIEHEEPPDATAPRRAELEQALREAKDRAERAAQDARDAEREAQDADREAERTASRLDTLRQQLRQAQGQADEAVQRQQVAAVAARRARHEADDTAAQAQRAQQELDQLD